MTIVASLTTIPSRINTECKRAIDSLLPQVDKVYLSVSTFYKRFQTSITIPEVFLEEPYKSKLQITFCEDLGPACKYLGSLENIPEDAWIFFCDDDQVYSPTLIERMQQVATDKSKVYQNRYETFMRYGTAGGLIHGYVGNMAHKSIVAGLVNFPIPDCARFIDDQWISAYYFLQGIPVVSTYIDDYHAIFGELSKEGWELWGPDGLINEGDRYGYIAAFEKEVGIKFIQNIPGCQIHKR